MRYLILLALLCSSCYVGVVYPTPTTMPSPTGTPSPTPWTTNTPTDDPTPTMEATFTACIAGSYAVAWWQDFTLYEWPNLTGEQTVMDDSNLTGYYPYKGQWLPIVAVLLIEEDQTYGTWYVVTGEGNPVYGWIDPAVLTEDCQY